MDSKDWMDSRNLNFYLDRIIKSSVQHQIRRMLGELEEKEALVLELRFGLDDDRPRTLQEIESLLDLTRERIR
jgi:RNA polymerase primary sigma factor